MRMRTCTCDVSNHRQQEQCILPATDTRWLMPLPLPPPPRALQLYTKEGVFLAEVGKRSSWVWAARARPKASAIACGCEDGSITMYSVTLGTVHALHGDRYAYREHMTDVVVQHLITEQKVRIRCRWVRAAAAAVVLGVGAVGCSCWRRCW